MNNLPTLGFALCGSFCTFQRAIVQMKALREMGYPVVPIMSFNAATINTRFGKAEDFIAQIEQLCGRGVIRTIEDAEPIGPKKMIDLLVVAPCTGNTLAKLANAITDTPVTMAAKSALRVATPVLLCPATNDALAASAQNIGRLMNTRHIYFVPLEQDDCEKKPYSLVAKFEMLPRCIEAALSGMQLRPVFL